MNLYRIFRTDEVGHDQYDSAVVAAETEQDAKFMAPHFGNEFIVWKDGAWFYANGEKYDDWYSCWVPVEQVQVELIGIAKEGTQRGVIISSFNAG